MFRADPVALGWEDFEPEDALFADFLGDPLVIPQFGARGPITFAPGVRLGINVYLALGADLTADPSTWALTQIPGSLIRYSSGITASTGRSGENDQVGPGSGSMVLDNRDGWFTRRNPTSPYYPYLTRNTPVVVEVNPGHVAYRFLEQFVTEWPVGFNTAATDFYVTIKTAGILRRLQQNNTTLKSAAYRAISGDTDLVQYWPCEDGEDAQTLASALGVDTPMLMLGTGTITPSASSSAINQGTEPLPTLGTGTTYLGGGTSMASQGTSTAWTYFASMYFTSVPVWTSGDGTAYLLYCPAAPTGTLVRWVVYWNDADNTVYLTVWSNSAVIATVAGPVLTNAEMINCWLTFWVSAKQNGSNVDYAFGVERTTTTDTSSSATSGTINAHSVRQLTGVLIFNGKSAAETVVGHIGVLSRALTTADDTPAYGALNGFTGETAVARLTRLCSEQGVRLTVQPTTADSTTMGPQTTAGFLDNVRDAEAVDGGVLYEQGFGLGYQPLSARYNLAPALLLDFTNGDLNGTPRISDDDVELRNQWTVTRTGGSSATYSDAESIAAEDLHEDSKTLPLESDEQAVQAAAWLVHLGIQDEPRWGSLPIRLDNTPGRALIQAWTAMGYGQKIAVANLPAPIAGAQGDTDVIREGHSERVDQFTWTAEMSTSPAPPYEVFAVEELDHDRLDTDGSTLAVAIDSDDTSLLVDTTDPYSPRWTTSDAEFPFDVAIGGERITVTDIVPDVADAYTDTRSNGWNTSTSGAAWTTNGGVAGDYATTGGKGTIAVSAVNSSRYVVTPAPHTDVSVSVKVSTPTLAAGGSQFVQAVARYADTSNNYLCRVEFTTTATVIITLRKRVANVESQLITFTTALTHVAGTKYGIRLEVEGSDLRGRVWVATTDATEPTDWDVDTTDTDLTAAGSVGVRTILSATNTNILPFTISWDDFHVDAPQIFTVTRSVNGISKSHAVGADVELWNGAVLAR